MKTPLELAVELGGGQTKVGEKLGLKQSAIGNWLARGRVPNDQVIALSAACNHKVTPHQLAPEIYPHPDDGLRALPAHLIPKEADKEAA